MFIRNRCVHEKISYPTVRQVRDALISAFDDITKYKNQYGINTENRDMIKYFSFTIPRLNNFHEEKIDHEILYLAFLDYIAYTYKGLDIKSQIDVQNTCRILKELANNNNVVATYSYFKGLSEAGLCIKEKSIA